MHDKGRTFNIIKGAFKEIGYTVFSTVLNSQNFGVPQNRERVYLVAFRNDLAINKFEFPSNKDGKKKCISDILEEKPVSAKYYLSTSYLSALRKHKEQNKKKGYGFGYVIRNVNGIAGAIVCGGMGRERNLIIDKRQKDLTPVTHIHGQVNMEGIRKFTPRECARLQGFPDDFKFDLADTHMYKQFGNSVTVPVIEAIAQKIKEVLEDGKRT